MPSFRAKKSIFICADDFGSSESVNQGILELLKNNSISGTSCMVSCKDFNKMELDPYLDRVGLHLKLCNEKMLPIFLARCVLGVISRENIFNKILEQILLYKNMFGMFPAFIDGHQHVHMLRGVRHSLIDALVDTNLQNKIWIRSISPMLRKKAYFKTMLLKLLSFNFNALLDEIGIKRNSMFAGFSNFSPRENIRYQMRYWLKSLKSGGVIMCHPATKTKKPTSLEQRRFLEFSYLSSAEFQYDCTEFGVTISHKL